MKFTMVELHEEAEREVEMRMTVYARRVNNGTMKPEVAQRRIALMQAIAEHLAELADKERLV
jgi:hypothetical protein